MNGAEATGPTATTPLSPCQAAAGAPPGVTATHPVPNVVGMMANQATWDVHAAGFTATQVITAAPASRPVPPGTVFAQAPAAGSSARPESAMILYVAPAS
jgi:beta-lactam-binding protein with PASTA domain